MAPAYGHCRNCGAANIDRRGLCRKCYRNPRIRKRFDKLPRCAETRTPTTQTTSELPPPTEAHPGSQEKVAVLEERASRGVCLWHPDDTSIRD